MLKSEGDPQFPEKDFAHVEKAASSRHFLTLSQSNIPKQRVFSAFQITT